MTIVIEKQKRRLTLRSGDAVLFACKIALGFCPVGAKAREGDGRTPEGEYTVCLKKAGKYGPALGLSYPSVADAVNGQADAALLEKIRAASQNGQRPPWGSFLGGEIYIHGGGTEGDWTAGCIALADADAQALYEQVPLGTAVILLP